MVDQSECRPASERIADRCKTLKLPAWRLCGAETIAEPSGWGPADHWLRSSLLRQWIHQNLDDHPPRSADRARELFPGCWIIPLSGGATGAGAEITVVMVLSSEALDAEHFQTICGSARVDTAIMKTALSPIARFERSDLARLSSILTWMHSDLLKAAEDDVAIHGFSNRLTETYEQLNLLYRLGRSVRSLDDPKEFVEKACGMLRDTLAFEWAGAKFARGHEELGGLSGRLVTVGRLPCESSRIAQLAERVPEVMPDQRAPHVLEPEEDELARLVGSEVAAAPLVSNDGTVGVLLAGGKTGPECDVSSDDLQLLAATAEYVSFFLNSATAYQMQRSMFLGTIRAITSTIEAKDRYTSGHSDRVAYLAAELAKVTGMSNEDVREVRLAGMLHDVGKIGVPEAVLCKPGKLTEEEYEQIKRHPVIGYSILKDIRPLRSVLPGVLYHHERWDGQGYPQGLRGTQIPLLGRVLAVADTFDAMSSDRSYRAALDRPTVLAEILRSGGTQLDPDLSKAFLTLDLTEYDRMIARHVARRAQAA